MLEITVPVYPIEKSILLRLLEAKNIRVNEYAGVYMDHSGFRTEGPREQAPVVLCSLRELGLAGGAVFAEIFSRASELGLFPCRPWMGLYLRLAYTGQPRSRNGLLSGAHCSPDGAVTVLSEFLEKDGAFPKGLYLRNVDGVLWLRGYVCGEDYRWLPEDVFALEKKCPFSVHVDECPVP